MTEMSFDGIKITWDQVAYLQRILTPQQLITFLAEKNTEDPKSAGLFGGQLTKTHKPSIFGKSGFNSE